MVTSPNDPERQALERAKEQDVRKHAAGLPRAFAHTISDAMNLAWAAGWEYRDRQGP